jgi:hypothetical protein
MNSYLPRLQMESDGCVRACLAHHAEWRTWAEGPAAVEFNIGPGPPALPGLPGRVTVRAAVGRVMVRRPPRQTRTDSDPCELSVTVAT